MFSRFFVVVICMGIGSCSAVTPQERVTGGGFGQVPPAQTFYFEVNEPIITATVCCSYTYTPEFKQFLTQRFMSALRDRDTETLAKIALMVAPIKGIPFDVTATDKTGTTLLMWAIVSQDRSLCKTLIQLGCDIDTADAHGMTPLGLALAAETPDTKIVKVLIRRGACVNKAFGLGRVMPLTHAMVRGKTELVQLLRNAGALFMTLAAEKVGVKEIDLSQLPIFADARPERTAAYGAIKKLFFPSAESAAAAATSTKKQVVTSEAERALWKAVEQDNLGEVKTLFERYAISLQETIYTLDQSRITLLHYAAMHGAYAVMRYLVEETEDGRTALGIKDCFGSTPLDIARNSEMLLSLGLAREGRQKQVFVYLQEIQAPGRSFA